MREGYIKMGLLDNVKSKINEVNKIAMEEYDILSSLDEDEDILLEAALRGEEHILGENYDENLNLDDDDFASGDDSESEDPDLGEDEDTVDFSFDSDVINTLETINDEDEEDEVDSMFDDETDIDELFDQVVDDMNFNDEF